MAGDFEFKIDWSAIVLETKEDYREFINKVVLPENGGILDAICGIIVLDALVM